MQQLHDFVVVANRLPVDRRPGPDGEPVWRPSPGGLVTALEPVMRSRDGVWIGWTGAADDHLEPFETSGMDLVPVPLSACDVEHFYEGMSNRTLWPLYHDVIATPTFHRTWWDSYVEVNRRFADAVLPHAATGATVWVQDYQLQLVPRMLREQRPDLRIGFFEHIPFPPYEIFAQLPWKRQVIDGLLGADLIGFQRPADANNLLRAARRVGLPTRGDAVLADARRSRPGARVESARPVVARSFPISVDSGAIDRLAREPRIIERARQIRSELGDPDTLLLGVDRLDYTKGIAHRLQAYGELLEDGDLTVPGTVLVQVATPSRERVEEYQQIRNDVETTVGRINGQHSVLGHPAVHYLHQTVDREELAALYLAADVMLVTPLRDGMNLVAKEYVSCRWDEGGALVLSEFAGAVNELTSSYVVNPHDIDGLKAAIVRAAGVSPAEGRRRMRAMRRRVLRDDVTRWATRFLDALHGVGAMQQAILGMPPRSVDLESVERGYEAQVRPAPDEPGDVPGPPPAARSVHVDLTDVDVPASGSVR